jgi:hypothetical protein
LPAAANACDSVLAPVPTTCVVVCPSPQSTVRVNPAARSGADTSSGVNPNAAGWRVTIVPGVVAARVGTTF